MQVFASPIVDMIEDYNNSFYPETIYATYSK